MTHILGTRHISLTVLKACGANLMLFMMRMSISTTFCNVFNEIEQDVVMQQKGGSYKQVRSRPQGPEILQPSLLRGQGIYAKKGVQADFGYRWTTVEKIVAAEQSGQRIYLEQHGESSCH